MGAQTGITAVCGNFPSAGVGNARVDENVTAAAKAAGVRLCYTKEAIKLTYSDQLGPDGLPATLDRMSGVKSRVNLLTGAFSCVGEPLPQLPVY
jgi:hypothetical protein